MLSPDARTARTEGEAAVTPRDQDARSRAIWARDAPRYDGWMRRFDRHMLRDGRAWLGRRAHGRVLEVAVGTGLNLPHYPKGTDLTGVDLSPDMLARARVRAADLGIDATLTEASATRLPFPDDSFDTVVSTLVMCTVADPVRALREVRRVLRPDGQYLFLEHGGSDDEDLARWQRRFDPIWKHLAGGCHLSRHAPQLVADAGFTIVELEVHEPKRTGPMKPFRLGVAA